MPSQVNAAGNRELFLITLGCIPWSNCLYTLEIALSVRPYALQKHKTALCYLLISQKALVTLVKEKKKKQAGLAVLAVLSPSVEPAQNMWRHWFQHHGPVNQQGQAYIPSQHFPYQVRTGARGWGLTEQQSGSDVPEPSENLLCLQKGRVPVRKMLQTWGSQV